jgi:formyltetrahydrofolate deformylase
MDWQISDSAVKKRVVIMVSKQEHCLYDLLPAGNPRNSTSRFPASSRTTTPSAAFVEWHGIPFHYVPVNPDNKQAAYAEISRIYDEVKGDTMVLARYMQILPPELCDRYPGR